MNHSKLVFTRRIVLSAVCLLSCAAAFCAGEVGTPLIGLARFGDGSVRAVYGLPNNLVVDSRTVGHFEAVSFSDAAGLVLTQTRIELVDRHLNVIGAYESNDSRVLLNVDGGRETAIAWLPANHSIVYWNGSGFTNVAVTGIDGGLVATAARKRAGSTAELLLKDAQGAVFKASVSLRSGALISLAAIAGAEGTAFWAGDTILFNSPAGLAFLAPDGSTQNILAKAEELSFQRIASRWIVITSGTSRRSWALNDVSMHISELPIPGVTSQEAAQ
jgi:hypothetical protein